MGLLPANGCVGVPVPKGVIIPHTALCLEAELGVKGKERLTYVLDDAADGGLEELVHGLTGHSEHALGGPLHEVHAVGDEGAGTWGQGLSAKVPGI